MHPIKIPRGYAFSAEHGPVTISDETVNDNFAPFERNKLAILSFALDLENNYKEIIKVHFFGRGDELRKKSEQFSAMVLDSDWCGFANKLGVLKGIIEEQNCLSVAERKQFHDLAQKVMLYRNGFTHGTPCLTASVVKVSYYKNGPKEWLITDEFLKKIEGELKEAFAITSKLLAASGTFVTVNSTA